MRIVVHRGSGKDHFVAEFPTARCDRYVLQLFVAGVSPHSSRAIANLKAICETHLKDRYELTVVDLYQNRELAKSEQILVAPMLVRLSPSPKRRMIGDLSQTERVLAALDLPPSGPSK